MPQRVSLPRGRLGLEPKQGVWGRCALLLMQPMQLKKSVSNSNNLFRGEGEGGGVATIGISSYFTGQNFGKVGAAKRRIF